MTEQTPHNSSETHEWQRIAIASFKGWRQARTRFLRAVEMRMIPSEDAHLRLLEAPPSCLAGSAAVEKTFKRALFIAASDKRRRRVAFWLLRVMRDMAGDFEMWELADILLQAAGRKQSELQEWAGALPWLKEPVEADSWAHWRELRALREPAPLWWAGKRHEPEVLATRAKFAEAVVASFQRLGKSA